MQYTPSFTQENVNVATRKKFGSRTARAEITPFDPEYGVEHLLEVTFAEWKITKEELEWSPVDEFKHFLLVLLGTTRSFWDEIVAATYPTVELKTEEGFTAARATFIDKVVGVLPRSPLWSVAPL